MMFFNMFFNAWVCGRGLSDMPVITETIGFRRRDPISRLLNGLQTSQTLSKLMIVKRFCVSTVLRSLVQRYPVGIWPSNWSFRIGVCWTAEQTSQTLSKLMIVKKFCFFEVWVHNMPAHLIPGNMALERLFTFWVCERTLSKACQWSRRQSPFEMWIRFGAWTIYRLLYLAKQIHQLFTSSLHLTRSSSIFLPKGFGFSELLVQYAGDRHYSDLFRVLDLMIRRSNGSSAFWVCQTRSTNSSTSPLHPTRSSCISSSKISCYSERIVHYASDRNYWDLSSLRINYPTVEQISNLLAFLK